MSLTPFKWFPPRWPAAWHACGGRETAEMGASVRVVHLGRSTYHAISGPLSERGRVRARDQNVPGSSLEDKLRAEKKQEYNRLIVGVKKDNFQQDNFKINNFLKDCMVGAGGMGGHKVGGNYAPGMLPLRIAQEAGYAQVRTRKSVNSN